MDQLDIIAKIRNIFEKYKYVILILGIGIILMAFPTSEKQIVQETPAVTDNEPTQEQKLSEILSQISGVGKVKVLLTEAAGPQTIYQTDENRTISADTDSLQTETIIVTNSDREERGLICSVTPPVYLGAIIVCQGGDNPSVRLSVVQAVSNVTGITTDRISVLKMK